MESLFRNSQLLEMLKAFGRVLNQYEIDFFLVGALARDIRLSKDPAFAPKRATKDVDIAIMLASEEQFYVVKDALVATGDFTAHDHEAIKLFYKQAIEVDLLPFGEIESVTRETRIEKPQPFILEVPGFKEVLPDAEPLDIKGFTMRVCSLEGIVLLKIIANADNPSRTKDLTDIEHIVNVYFELNYEKIFLDFADVPELYETNDVNYLQLVSAQVIGRVIGRLLANSPALHQRILNILSSKSSGRYWAEMAAGIAGNY
jgi:predicted nucleotidyltransferase